MFNDRQLLGLGLLLREILSESRRVEREALLTVFSDFLRYQNMLCRYDTYALKCQDIFSVHGFPVGLVQCENNLLGVPKIGSGSFRHFVEKYLRAKDYCSHPFETNIENGRTGKRHVFVTGERIQARFAESAADAQKHQSAWLQACPAGEVDLTGIRLDGVFADPPYFDNVQYAELMDFCFVWMRLGLASRYPAFRSASTRHADELTGNTSMARDLECFGEGLSKVFRLYAAALKPGAPFVFTYHHNDPFAYLPIVVAVLDARLECTATLPAAAEMSASLHIAGTGSSILDSIFICRPASGAPRVSSEDLRISLKRDIGAMEAAGVHVSEGDFRCLLAGHVARLTINTLQRKWNASTPVGDRFVVARHEVSRLLASMEPAPMLTSLWTKQRPGRKGETIVVAASV